MGDCGEYFIMNGECMLWMIESSEEKVNPGMAKISINCKPFFYK